MGDSILNGHNLATAKKKKKKRSLILTFCIQKRELNVYSLENSYVRFFDILKKNLKLSPNTLSSDEKSQFIGKDPDSGKD